MRTIMLTAIALLSLGAGIANAQTVPGTVPQSETQYNLTAGAAGWG